MSIQIEVLYFAAVRERLGRERESVILEGPATVDALWEVLCARHDALCGLRGHLRIAVDEEFADPDTPVHDGATVALIPPVSGGSGEGGAEAADAQSLRSEDGRFAVGLEPLDARAVERLVRRDEAGALVTFQGVVRDHTGAREVDHLEYETYASMALGKLRAVCEEIEASFDDVRLAVHHRHGRLEIGEAAVVVVASSPHRADAFDAARRCIDRLKEEVPIWKKEFGPDGDVWVGWGP